jgi:signal transduction histidine kinase
MDGFAIHPILSAKQNFSEKKFMKPWLHWLQSRRSRRLYPLLNPLPENLWLVGGFSIAALLMAIVSSISHQNVMQLIESNNRSRQTDEIIQDLGALYATMTVAESGRRGYVYLDDAKEYFRYQDAIKDLKPELRKLEQDLKTNSQQAKRFNKLRALLEARISLLQESIDLHQLDRSAIARQKEITEESVNLRDRIEFSINEIQTEETQRLNQWQEEIQTNANARRLIESLLTVLSFVILFSVFLALKQQVTKRKEAETREYALAKEQELSILKLQFFSMASHEFRTPLSIILGSSQLLSESHNWSEERRFKTFRRIQASAQLMTRLLNDILTFTRAEAGELEYQPTNMDVEAFCLNLVEDLQVSLEVGQILKLESTGNCGHADLDETLLYQILSNLLVNAVKYSAVNSPVLLKLCRQVDQIQFQVIDHGVGIPADALPHIFDLFYRAENVGAIAGTGLGLAVVKKCVDLHRGRIDVVSTVDEGTTFTVELPQ